MDRKLHYIVHIYACMHAGKQRLIYISPLSTGRGEVLHQHRFAYAYVRLTRLLTVDQHTHIGVRTSMHDV